ncbi:MAG: methyltransferase domain-containing protein [Elainella sp.]
MTATLSKLQVPLAIHAVTTLKPVPASLMSYHIDSPQPSDPLGNRLLIAGWAVGRREAVSSIEVITDLGMILAKIPVDQLRSDVGQLYSQAAANPCGFGVRLETANFTLGTELWLYAVLGSDERVPIGLVQFGQLAQGAKLSKPMGEDRLTVRWTVACQYLKGDGIEIGALHSPLAVPEIARVKYVDRLTVPQLRIQYRDLADQPLVEVDIVDNGETLATIAESSQDFVIANHFLEHCQNPLKALENMLRVLRPGGLLYLAIPDKRYSFDATRPTTTLDHIWRDYQEGPEWSRQDHFTDWVKYVNGVTEAAEIQRHVAHLMEIDYSIHYHVWTEAEIVEILLLLRKKLGAKFENRLLLQNDTEIILLLEKAG